MRDGGDLRPLEPGEFHRLMKSMGGGGETLKSQNFASPGTSDVDKPGGAGKQSQLMSPTAIQIIIIRDERSAAFQIPGPVVVMKGER